MQLPWPALTNPPELVPSEAHVWAVPLVTEDTVWQSLWATLSPDERARAEEFRFDELRKSFVAARGALRRLLGQYLNVNPVKIEIAVGERGKPRLGSKYAVSNLRFNLSHSGDLALIAVAAGCEVGVDIEQVREVSKLEHIARRYFHSAEIEAILATTAEARNDAFLRCWTMKEAVLKAYGTGIAESLDAFQVPFNDTGEGWIDLSTIRRTDKPAQCWVRQLAPWEGYVGAVATIDRQLHVRRFTLSI